MSCFAQETHVLNNLLKLFVTEARLRSTSARRKASAGSRLPSHQFSTLPAEPHVECDKRSATEIGLHMLCPPADYRAVEKDGLQDWRVDV